ncbi:MAG: dihydroorotate dehydrogenase-like protein [Bacteroidales bacterium]|nr:dihydroorotate dehydrogenase-like protein [Bacteroidales bacterium]
MTKLKTSYMGLELKNPIIVGANNLVNNIDNLKKMEEAGAAAVVYRSLFEEQIQLEAAQMDDELDEYAERHAEMTSIFPNLEHAGPREHLLNVKKAREALSIPLIASLNAVYKETWLEYAKLLEDTGVDGLELNFYYVPRDPGVSGSDVVDKQIEICKTVKSSISIPVSVKISPFYAYPLNVITQLDKTGVDAFVLFNRIFQPEIDIEKEEHIVDFPLSREYESKLPLRFTGLLYGNINASIASARGLQDGKDVIKMLLAGADAVQVVGTLYKNKIEHIGKMLEDIENWMAGKGYKSLKDFRGKLSDKELNDPFVYKRAQYVDLLMKSDELFKKKTV